MTEDERKKLDEIHAYLFRPPTRDMKPRADQLDELLAGARYGKVTLRILLWIAGLVGAVVAFRDDIAGLFR